MRRILVVEDDIDVAELIKLVATENGHSVDTAHSGHQALAMMEAADYDLLITDYHMPEMTGMQLIQEALRFNPDYVGKVIFLTGERLSRMELHAIPDATDRVIVKPFRPDDLRRALATFLERGSPSSL